ncbi:hypothetical protein BaRGS_00038148 [Batillaria attramentaria]|uniref:C17orf113 probable zinc finger domain-containing protein n=1 Tax=Batillaria attramentaria TaxID=370345 RepID=A0ABD0J6U1_9CAEN
MFCSLCIAAVARNSFTVGCSNFRKSALQDHVMTSDHKAALAVPQHQENKELCDKAVLSKQAAMMTAVRGVSWLIKEDLPLSKFPSQMKLLRECGAANLEFLDVSKDVHYDTRTADELLECLAEQVAEEAKSELTASPYVAVMADETTDITVNKRLGLYVRTVDADMQPKTRFLTNVHVPDG